MSILIGHCLLTIGALWLMGTQNITYKIQVKGEGFAYYTEHIVEHIKCHRLKQSIMY